MNWYQECYYSNLLHMGLVKKKKQKLKWWKRERKFQDLIQSKAKPFQQKANPTAIYVLNSILIFSPFICLQLLHLSYLLPKETKQCRKLNFSSLKNYRSLDQYFTSAVRILAVYAMDYNSHRFSCALLQNFIISMTVELKLLPVPKKAGQILRQLLMSSSIPWQGYQCCHLMFCAEWN